MLSALQFGDRAKRVKVTSKINRGESLDYENLYRAALEEIQQLEVRVGFLQDRLRQKTKESQKRLISASVESNEVASARAHQQKVLDLENRLQKTSTQLSLALIAAEKLEEGNMLAQKDREKLDLQIH